MNLQHLEEQVASAEERALHLSLIGHSRLELEELAEVRDNLNALERHALQTCPQGARLREKIVSIRSELEAVEYAQGLLGKATLPPIAA